MGSSRRIDPRDRATSIRAARYRRTRYSLGAGRGPRPGRGKMNFRTIKYDTSPTARANIGDDRCIRRIPSERSTETAPHSEHETTSRRSINEQRSTSVLARLPSRGREQRHPPPLRVMRAPRQPHERPAPSLFLSHAPRKSLVPCRVDACEGPPPTKLQRTRRAIISK